MKAPEIVKCAPKKLIGVKLKMSLLDNRIPELWGNFGPRRKEIKNNLNQDLISMVVYGKDHFSNFKASNSFERWAAVEVEDFSNIPSGLERYELTAGLYAVFQYKGNSSDHSIFQYIYGEWIPNSGYVLDDRPHFEVLGEKYRNNDPESEEEIWIPIREKALAD